MECTVSCPSAFAGIKAAIFDMDGTILNSMGIWAQIDIEFLAKRGLSPTKEYLDAVSTLPPLAAAEFTARLFSLGEASQDIVLEWNEMALKAYRTQLSLKAGAAKYLRRLKDGGIKLALATNSPEVLYRTACRSNGIYELFDVLLSTEAVGKGKAHPDIFITAAELLGVRAHECMVFEDSLTAATTAKNAGMKVIGVFDEYADCTPEEMLKAADGFIRSFENAPLFR